MLLSIATLIPTCDLRSPSLVRGVRGCWPSLFVAGRKLGRRADLLHHPLSLQLYSVSPTLIILVRLPASSPPNSKTLCSTLYSIPRACTLDSGTSLSRWPTQMIQNVSHYQGLVVLHLWLRLPYPDAADSDSLQAHSRECGVTT